MNEFLVALSTGTTTTTAVLFAVLIVQVKTLKDSVKELKDDFKRHIESK